VILTDPELVEGGGMIPFTRTAREKHRLLKKKLAWREVRRRAKLIVEEATFQLLRIEEREREIENGTG